MDRSAKALESFCGDDETWVDSWRVSAIGRGWNAAMPGFSKETVGLTDQRLLWLEENLETVDVAAIESVTSDEVSHHSAPGMVRAGGVALVLGAMATAAMLFVFSFSLTTALVPLAIGAGIFALSIGFARARQKSDAQLMQHRLQIETDDSVVIVWGDQEDMATLKDAIEPETTE